MKTLGPEGICPYIESLINMCIPSPRVSSSSNSSSLLSLRSSLFPSSPLVLIFLSLTPSSSSVVFPPCLSRPLVHFLSSSLPSYQNRVSSLGACVRWEALREREGGWWWMGHQQHDKQTTCLLPRSWVVNVDRNRSGQPCGWFRRDRADGEWEKFCHASHQGPCSQVMQAGKRVVNVKPPVCFFQADDAVFGLKWNVCVLSLFQAIGRTHSWAWSFVDCSGWMNSGKLLHHLSTTVWRSNVFWLTLWVIQCQTVPIGKAATKQVICTLPIVLKNPVLSRASFFFLPKIDVLFRDLYKMRLFLLLPSETEVTVESYFKVRRQGQSQFQHQFCRRYCGPQSVFVFSPSKHNVRNKDREYNTS